MKHAHINYAVVGAFVLAMGVGFVVIISFITGQTGDIDTYYVYYRKVTALKYGTPVTYEGFQIGQIEKVQPERHEGRIWYRVDVSVRRGWKIPSDSVAALVASGLLSRITIDISEGKTKTFLKPGQEIKGRALVDVFSALTSIVSDVNDVTQNSVKPMMDRLYQGIDVLASALEKKGPHILNNLEELSAALNKDIVADVQITAEELKKSAQLIQNLLGNKNIIHIKSFLKNMDTTSQNLKDFSQKLQHGQARLDDLINSSVEIVEDNQNDVRQSITDLRISLQAAAQYIDSIAYNLESASRHMNEFSQQIRHNPALLLGSKPPVDDRLR